MSKNSRRCPNCGAKVSPDMKYCRKCQTRLDSGRVETLSGPGRREPQRSADDPLRNLPRPVRPEEDQTVMPAARGDGFFVPEERNGGGEARVRPERQGRMGMADPNGPRPTQTAYGGMSPDRGSRRSDRKMWQIAAVLAVILVIIVVAIVLVIKLNQPPAQPQTSENFQGGHVINTSTDNPPPTSEPTAEPTIQPTATPTAPTPTPFVTPTAIPTPTATPNTYGITEVNETVYINGIGVNIRSGPGTDYSVISSESTGYQLTRTGRTNNGWSRVQYNGGVGYVSDSFITTTKPAATPAANYTVVQASGTVTVTANANLRKGPGTEYDSVAVAAQGTQLSRTGTCNGWTRVQYQGQDLFISSNYVSDGTGGTTTNGTVTCNTASGVNVRSGPGTSYSILGTLAYNSSLTCTGQSGDWYQVSYNGQTGYVNASYVTKS